MDITTQLIEAAEVWNAGGCLVLGTTPGMKKPNGLWRDIANKKTERPTIAQIQKDLSAGIADGLCVLTGPPSGQLEMLEIEGAASELVQELYERIEDAGLDGLWQRITNGCVERSPKGGIHYFFRSPSALGSTGLAWIPDDTADKGYEIAIETRGAGGLVVVAPSPGGRKGRKIQPDKPYMFVPETDGPTGIPDITTKERDALYAVCKACCQKPAAAKIKPCTKKKWPEDSPAGKFNNNVTFEQVLTAAGWTKGGTKTSEDYGNTTEYTRPGDNLSTARSAVVNDNGFRTWLQGFSSSTDLQGHVPTPFEAWRLLNGFKEEKDASAHLSSCLSDGMAWQDIISGKQPQKKVTWIKGGGVTVSFT